MRGVPLVEHVAEAGQELLAGLDAEDLSAGPGRAGGWRRLPARMPGWISGRRRAGWRAGGLPLMRAFHVMRGSPDRPAAAMAGYALSLEPLLDFFEDLLQ